MPKKPTHRHVLRDLRKVLGKTQAQFAELLGVAMITIARIENGTLKLSLDLAIKIQGQTGASYEELLKGETGQLLDYQGKPYDPSAEWVRPDSIYQFYQRQGFDFWLWVLLEASIRNHNGEKFGGVMGALSQSLWNIRRSFGLEKTTEAILRDLFAGVRPAYPWSPGFNPPNVEPDGYGYKASTWEQPMGWTDLFALWKAKQQQQSKQPSPKLLKEKGAKKSRPRKA